jgi:hypothetical protein
MINKTRDNTRSSRAILVTLIVVVFAFVGTYLTLLGKASSPVCTTTLSPGANIASAFNVLSAGQTLCLHTGHYGSSTTLTALTNNSGSAGAPLTLTTAPGEAPATVEGVLTIGNNSSTGMANNITVSHLIFEQDYVTSGRVNTQYGCSSNTTLSVTITGSNDTFEYNEISETNVAPQYRDTALGVNYSPATQSNIIIRYNKIHDFGACDHFDHGIYFDHVTGGQIYGNWIWNGGCAYGLGGDTTKGCGSGIQLYVDPSNTSVYSNVIDGTGVGFYYYGVNNRVYNNVITNMRGNFYANGSSEPAAGYVGGTDSSSTYSNNDDFNTGQLCNGCTATSSGNISSDPLFVNAANHDYRLQPGSPVASYGLWNGVDPSGTPVSNPPTAAFTFSPSSPTTGQQVTFNASTSTCTNTPCSYSWSDRGTSLGTGQTLNFTFQFAETKQVTLTITDARGATASVEHDVIVSTAGTTYVTGDVNKDGHVDIFDLSLLLSSYGQTTSACIGTPSDTCDLNADGHVDIFDLSMLLSNWGK